jgi:hypothetical protein
VFVVPYGQTRKPPDNYATFTVYSQPSWPPMMGGVERSRVPPESPAGVGRNDLFAGQYFLYRRDA